MPAPTRVLARFVLVFVLWTLYVTAFWGIFRAPWPQAVRRYAGFATRSAWQVYRQNVNVTGNSQTHYMLLWVSMSFVAGAVLPVLAASLSGRRVGEIGLGPPNRWGWRVLLVCVVVSVPFAFLIAYEQPPAGQAGPATFYRSPLLRFAGAASTVPEHILITGICLATFLPRARLPVPPPLAPVAGRRLRRILRWLGLAQPADPQAGRFRRGLAWWGLDAYGLLAIVGAGALFGVCHMGKRPIEFTTSFPGGMAVSYLTYRSRSILPGWLAHIGLMGVGYSFMRMLGRL